MGHITVVANQKGGVGKTTTTQAMICALAHKGYKVLAVDMDPQCNLSYTLGGDHEMPSIFELMRGVVSLLKVVQHTKTGDLIQGSQLLSSSDMTFTGNRREYILSEKLAPLLPLYDFIVVDTPPTLGVLTINALTAASDVVIPLGADVFSLQGLSQLNETIVKVRKHCNPALVISGLLLTRHNDRTVLGRDLKEYIDKSADAIGTQPFGTRIRENVAVREIQFSKGNLFDSSKKSNAAVDYMAFVEEYLVRAGKDA